VSSLNSTEKRKIEQLLGMETGYVLDFSNRTFAEFITDYTGLNIFDVRYDHSTGSKANRLRKLWQVEDDAIVGKLMDEMLDYGFSGTRETALAGECRRIVARLVQSGPCAPANKAEGPQITESTQRSRSLAELKDEFFRLASGTDRNKAGLTLEKLLNRLFELYGLHPRLPFRVTGEQIDGSFVFDTHVYLIESKWEKQPLPEADLLIFRGKIEGKSTFTRGVFIALNDISTPAREAITRGKAPSFFVMNGHDLLMILSEAITLPEFLKQRVRLLGEEGRVCVPFADLKANQHV
jgi:hypothetical protein